jgi:hypothetical protein
MQIAAGVVVVMQDCCGNTKLSHLTVSTAWDPDRDASSTSAALLHASRPVCAGMSDSCDKMCVTCSAGGREQSKGGQFGWYSSTACEQYGIVWWIECCSAQHCQHAVADMLVHLYNPALLLFKAKIHTSARKPLNVC